MQTEKAALFEIKRKRDDEDVEEKKINKKRFTSKFSDLLKEYMEKHREISTSTNLTNFALAHGFSFSQAKHNWYEVIRPTLKEEQKKPGHKQDETAKYSPEITQVVDCTEESEEEEPEPIVFKSPSKVSKVIELPDVSYLKPFIFETNKNRFYVFRYNQDHLLYEFKEVSYTEKNFTISVKVRGQFTLDNLEFCLGSFYDMAGGVDNTQRSSETFTLSEYLPKDVDLKSVQYGENYHPEFGPIFVVTFDKKVSTFVPVKQAMWSRSKPVPNTQPVTEESPVEQEEYRGKNH